MTTRRLVPPRQELSSILVLANLAALLPQLRVAQDHLGRLTHENALALTTGAPAHIRYPPEHLSPVESAHLQNRLTENHHL